MIDRPIASLADCSTQAECMAQISRLGLRVRSRLIGTVLH